jgi:hypothetical protein
LPNFLSRTPTTSLYKNHEGHTMFGIKNIHVEAKRVHTFLDMKKSHKNVGNGNWGIIVVKAIKKGGKQWPFVLLYLHHHQHSDHTLKPT